jgi:hypothetical protein
MAGEIIAVPALESFPFAVALREQTLAYALVKGAHLFGIAMLVGSVVAFDLRVLGYGRTIPVTWLARHLLPLAVASLTLIIPTGLALFAANATVLQALPAFMLKMVIIMTGAVLAIAFHTGPYKQVTHWDTNVAAPVSARIIATLSVVGWLSVLALATQLEIN